jgi:pyruvate formate-lyase activating enzyme-like uncharacterized protein
VQLANRLTRRSKNAANNLDIITKDGTFIRGAVYLPELKPGFGYRKKISSLRNEKTVLKKLNLLKKKLEKDFGKKFIIDDFKYKYTEFCKTWLSYKRQDVLWCKRKPGACIETYEKIS